MAPAGSGMNPLEGWPQEQYQCLEPVFSGPEECAFASTIVHSEGLVSKPIQDMFDLEWLSPTRSIYIPPSQVRRISDYHDAAKKASQVALGVYREDPLMSEQLKGLFGPPLSKFEEALREKTGIVINCRGDDRPPLEVKNLQLVPNSWENRKVRAFAERFGLRFSGGPDALQSLHHDIAAAMVFESSNSLVMVVADRHDSIDVNADFANMVSYLSTHVEGGVDLRVGFEEGTGYIAERVKTVGKPGKARSDRWRKNVKLAAGDAEVFLRNMLSDQSFVDPLRKQWMRENPNLPASLFEIASIVSSLVRDYLITGTKAEYFGFENEQLQKQGDARIAAMAGRSVDAIQRDWAGHPETIEQRTKKSAEHVIDIVKGLPEDKKHLVVVRYGGHHVREFINQLTDGHVSSMLLVSPSYVSPQGQ